MKIDQSLDQRFAAIGGASKEAAKQSEGPASVEKCSDEYFVREGAKFPEKQSAASKYSECHRRKTVNDVFADFLLGVRLDDQPRQHDAWNSLMRYAWRVALRLGFVRCSLSGDYEQVATDCLLKEVQKHASLTACEILKGRVKTGHAWSLQNRPYEMARDVILIYPAFS